MGIDDFRTKDYFKNGSLQSEALADDVLEKLDIVTMEDNGEMYVYEDGVYNNVGELRVKQFLTNILGNDYSRHCRAEVMEVAQNKTAKSRVDFGQSEKWLCLGNCQYNIETAQL